MALELTGSKLSYFFQVALFDYYNSSLINKKAMTVKFEKPMGYVNPFFREAHISTPSHHPLKESKMPFIYKEAFFKESTSHLLSYKSLGSMGYITHVYTSPLCATIP